MRPFKHVARKIYSGGTARYQNILGIDLARFAAPWGVVPVVATTEDERITIYYWNDADGRWDSFEIDHDPLTTVGDTPDAPLDWNWSDRVAVACSSDTVHVVYKRSFVENDAVFTSLVHDRYHPRDPSSGDQRLELLDRAEMARVEPGKLEIGRSLWASCQNDGSLVVLYQVRSAAPGQTSGEWTLTLLKVMIDSASGDVTSTSTAVDVGGFDLDARQVGGSLQIVYRRTSEAFRMPLVMMLGGRVLTSGAEADPFYEPLRLATVDLGTFDTRIEALPGGEHPQIQPTPMLFVTFDRPSRIELSLDTPVIPLPPRRPRAVWQPGPTDKVAIVREGSETYRGTLLTADARVIPHSHADMSSATMLFADRSGLLVQSSPFRNFPVHVLGVERAEKRLTIDVLHHRDVLGLYRSRLQTSLSDGQLLVTDRVFEVWDMGHGQITDPDDMAPNAEAENEQFEPTGEVSISRSSRVVLADLRTDNTMGGHVTMEPASAAGFHAYTDLGDGGLRVVFAPDIPPLSEPPPVETEKILRPDQVTGPGVPCDVWVELTAADWIPARLPGYDVGIGKTKRSLGSAMEVPIDFLLNACDILTANGDGPDGAPLEPSVGLTRPQLRAIDVYRAGLAASFERELDVDDGTRLDLTIAPAGPIADIDLEFSVAVNSSTPETAWTFLRIDNIEFESEGPVLPTDPIPAGAPLMVEAGNPVTMRFAGAGTWRVSMFFEPAAGASPPGAFIDLRITESTYRMLTTLYTGIADGPWHEIGDLEDTLLRYEMRYGVGTIGDRPANIRIRQPDERASELRFFGGGNTQGRIGLRHVVSFTSDEMRLKSGLDLLFRVNSFAVTLKYGRQFTPGMLLRDSRARDVLNGRRLGDAPSETLGRSDELRHAAIGAKPAGDATISDDSVDIDVSLTAGAITVAAIITALVLIGAAALVAVIVGLVAGIAAASAAGLVGGIAAIALTIVLVIIIATAVPRAVADFAESTVSETITSQQQLDQLNDQPLLRYSGEGAAEAIARMALVRARDMGHDVPAPAEFDDEGEGRNRTYGQIFQMVFVSEGLCRVLLRLEDCDPVDPPTLPDPPGDGDDDPRFDPIVPPVSA